LTLRTTALVWLGLALLPTPALADLYAERLTASNLEHRRVGGPDADAGIGDWALGNGRVCAAVSSADHESHLSMQGGVLIDLGRCGAANDQWSVLQPLFNLSPNWTVPIRKVRAEHGDGRARILIDGEGDGLRTRLVYSVDLTRPDELRVDMRITRAEPGRRLFALGAVAIHGSGQLRPFTLSTHAPGRSLGFEHPFVDTDSILSLVRGIAPADAHVLVGGDRIEPGLSYGLRIDNSFLEAEGEGHRPLPHMHINGYDFTLMGVMARPYWIGSAYPPGLLQLAQLPLMDLAVGNSLSVGIVLWLGGRADVASATDALFADAPAVTGRVDDPETRLHVATREGAPVTVARPARDGRFRFRLPEGRYAVRAVAPGGRTLESELHVEPEGGDLGRLVLGTPARVILPRGETMRLVFVGLEGTPDPRFGDDLLGFRVGERETRASPLTNTISLAGVAADPRRAVIAPGRYRVLATRGLEYGVSESVLEIPAGADVKLEIEPPTRVLETPGWIAADLHVHSGESFDSSLPLADQARAFAAQGAEVLVATEHDRVIDPVPALRRLGLEDRIAGVIGVEITTTVTGGETPHTIAHSNAFPLRHRPEAYRGGAPEAEGKRLRSVRADLRTNSPGALLQLNHPRDRGDAAGDLYYFSHLAVAGKPFDPSRPLEDAPNRVLVEVDPGSGLRDLDFDAIELMNGTEVGRYRLLHADWVSLLLQGEVRTATANSDSHHSWEVVGIPRTYVRLADDRPGAFDQDAFVENLRKGRAFGTTGPLLDARLEAAELGDLYRGTEGTLRISVRSAPWVPVSEVRVIVNGEILARRRVAPGSQTLEVPLRFAGDSFVIVEAEGSAEDPYTAIVPGSNPLAFTNPIFVDADDDGRWTAPGLPERIPETIQRAR